MVATYCISYISGFIYFILLSGLFFYLHSENWTDIKSALAVVGIWAFIRVIDIFLFPLLANAITGVFDPDEPSSSGGLAEAIASEDTN